MFATDGIWSVSTVLSVIVTDVNDNAPTFTRSLYDFSAEPSALLFDLNSTNANYVVQLGQVTASDGDSGVNAMVRYSIVARHLYVGNHTFETEEQETFPQSRQRNNVEVLLNEAFWIDPLNGTIFALPLQLPLYEQLFLWFAPSSYNLKSLQINVKDGADELLTEKMSNQMNNSTEASFFLNKLALEFVVKAEDQAENELERRSTTTRVRVVFMRDIKIHSEQNDEGGFTNKAKAQINKKMSSDEKLASLDVIKVKALLSANLHNEMFNAIDSPLIGNLEVAFHHKKIQINLYLP